METEKLSHLRIINNSMIEIRVECMNDTEVHLGPCQISVMELSTQLYKNTSLLQKVTFINIYYFHNRDHPVRLT